MISAMMLDKIKSRPEGRRKGKTMRAYEVYFNKLSGADIELLRRDLEMLSTMIFDDAKGEFFLVFLEKGVSIKPIINKFNVKCEDVTGQDLIAKYWHHKGSRGYRPFS